MRIYDVTIRVEAENESDAVIKAVNDLYWNYYNDEPAEIWHEIVGVAEKVSK